MNLAIRPAGHHRPMEARVVLLAGVGALRAVEQAL
jgi:hypothetical protein